MTSSCLQLVSPLVLLVALVTAGCSKPEVAESAPPPSKAHDFAQARDVVNAGAVVIDVRTPEEYADEHHPNAVNIPVDELGSRMAEVAKLVGGDNRKPIVVYCRSGSRSANAKKQLEAAGYSRVVNGKNLATLR